MERIRHLRPGREALTHRYRVPPETRIPKSFFGVGDLPDPANGFDPLPSRGKAVTNELIDKLREEDLG